LNFDVYDAIGSEGSRRRRGSSTRTGHYCTT